MDPYEVDGYQTEMVGFQQAMLGAYGPSGDVMGALAARAAAGDPAAAKMVTALIGPQPAWRQAQVAPGVHVPRPGLVPLPLRPDTLNGIFTSAVSIINFTGRPQKPWRGERVETIVVRSGASAAATIPKIRGGIITGVDIEMAQISDMALEHFQPQSFGNRMVMRPAQGGIDISMQVFLTAPLTAPDTVTTDITIFGSWLA